MNSFIIKMNFTMIDQIRYFIECFSTFLIKALVLVIADSIPKVLRGIGVYDDFFFVLFVPYTYLDINGIVMIVLMVLENCS